MTWLFDASGNTMDVYDQEGNLVAADRVFGSNDPDNDNGSWSGDFPDEVLEVMDETAVAEFQASGITMYALQILRHAAFEKIEEGTP